MRTETKITAILDLLLAYEGDNIWQDVIIHGRHLSCAVSTWVDLGPQE
jgi:23S rRNA maturation mini-RNase III